MYSKYLKICGINDLKEFSRLATMLDGDVVISKGKYVIDGKSLMGLLSIDTSNGVKVEYDGADDKYFTEFKNFCEKVLA